MQCAKCHNHPFERWTQDDYYSLAAFFARVKQKPDKVEPAANPQSPGAEFIYSDRSGEVVQPRTGKTMPPKIMGMAAPAVPPTQEVPPRRARAGGHLRQQPVLRQVDRQSHLVSH